MYDAPDDPLGRFRATSGAEPVRMPRAQLFLVYARHLRERDVQRARDHGETPQRIAELARDRLAVERAALHDMLAHVPQHLTRLFGETGSGIEQPLLSAQCGIDRASGGVLIGVEVGRLAQLYVTRGSAFA